jgi:hypothetical protein
MALMTSGWHKPTKSDSRTRRTPKGWQNKVGPREFRTQCFQSAESSLRFCPDTRYLARDRQLQKFVNFLPAVDVHDALP